MKKIPSHSKVSAPKLVNTQQLVQVFLLHTIWPAAGACFVLQQSQPLNVEYFLLLTGLHRIGKINNYAMQCAPKDILRFMCVYLPWSYPPSRHAPMRGSNKFSPPPQVLHLCQCLHLRSAGSVGHTRWCAQIENTPRQSQRGVTNGQKF